ncbi:adenosine nucleotide hydrolase, partial [Chromobacterium piscinae]
ADLVREFVDAGFSARIVMVNTALADEKWLGR